MSYNNKKNENSEIDARNIRSHLNASLDLDDIRVSEDLINRTLAAIKEQPVMIDKNERKLAESHSKFIKWSRYVRGFATAAAALVIIVAGYAAIRQLPLGMKKDAAAPEINGLYAANENGAASQSMDTADTKSDTGSTDALAGTGSDTTISAAEGSSETPVVDNQFTISAETYGAAEEEKNKEKTPAGTDDTSMEDANTDDEDVNENEIMLKPKTNMAISKLQVTLTFRDIFLPSPEQAEYIMITDNVNNTSVNLTNIVDIQAFYQVMDSHNFMNADADDTASEAYTVEMLDPDTQALYTMQVGSNLRVRFAQGDTSVENTYAAADGVLFKEDLQKFYTEHRK